MPDITKMSDEGEDGKIGCSGWSVPDDKLLAISC